MRTLLPLLAGLLLACPLARAADPLLFISALASGEKSGVYAFQFDPATGELKPLHHTSDLQKPFFLAVSPDHRFLYAVNVEKVDGKAQEFVAAYAIADRTGELKRLNQQPTRGATSCYLAVDATGKTLVTASYSSGNVASLPIHPDGSLGEIVSLMQHSGSSVDPRRQTGPFAHSIVISPDNRFALAADLGIDKIMIYHLDAATATLTPNEAQPFVTMPPGTGPRHTTFSPDARHYYVIGEMKNTVTVFDYAADKGTLTQRQNISTLPDGFDGKSYTADIKITPDGQYLYGTNRGHDTIAAYKIAGDGTLSLIALEPSLGKGPQNLLITPDGHWLLCANMPGNNVAVFQIDSTTGRLKPTGTPTEVPTPSCIRLVP